MKTNDNEGSAGNSRTEPPIEDDSLAELRIDATQQSGNDATRTTDANRGPDKDKLPPEVPRDARLAAILAATNPLLEAAQPLLRSLADMPKGLPSNLVETLNKMLNREVMSFQSLCHTANLRHEHVIAGSYALCTALDEAVLRTPWGSPGANGDASVWANMSLTTTHHGESTGGDKFFLLLGRLAATPSEHTDLLELMYVILGLGFEGRYAGPQDGARKLDAIRHRLRAMLDEARDEVPGALSPHWQGAGAGKFRPMRSLPVWVTVSVLALGLLGLFGWYKFQLGNESMRLQERIVEIGKLPPPPPPPAPVRNPLRLKALLADEIARGTIEVDEDDVRSAVTFKGDDMFVPGKAALATKLQPLLQKVAVQVADVTGKVVVTGHTDNLPIRTRDFPNNQVLSEKRAQAVAQELMAAGVAPGRIRVEGRGDAMPLADNAKPAGRARNRRVDILVTQAQDDAASVPTGSQSASAVTNVTTTTRTNPDRGTSASPATTTTKPGQ